MTSTVEVVDDTGLGLAVDELAALARTVLDREGVQGTVVLALVEEQTIVELNGLHRGLWEPTDVLSYPADADESDWPESPEREGLSPELGEVIVCPAVVWRYVEEAGCDPHRQMAWTVIHGVLHLLGYDHEIDQGEMRLREQSLLEGLWRSEGL